MAQIAVHLPIMRLVGIPRQAFLLKIIRAFSDLRITPVATETEIIPVFPLFQGRLKSLLVELGDVHPLLLGGQLMAIQAGDACFLVLMVQELGIFPRFEIRLSGMTLGAGLGVFLVKFLCFSGCRAGCASRKDEHEND